MSVKNFFGIIGNPPYQEETVGNQKSYGAPIYDKFLDEAFKISERVEMVHPARFLSNAGGTKEEWNRKMLNDPHFKVLEYEADSAKLFPSVDIKGGIAITYRDENRDFGPVGVFVAFDELDSIRKKVWSVESKNLSSLIFNRGLYRFSDYAYKVCPGELSKNSDSRIGSSSFTRMPTMFFDVKPNDRHEYIQLFGLDGRDRTYKWIREDYVNLVDSFYKYKVMVPKANGSGALGEVLSTPLIGQPLIGHTETFLSIGPFDTDFEAEACLKYIKTKFARVLLGILKITQDNSAEKWLYVPAQDFTPESDIDWTQSVAEIDTQLYKKYGLDHEEIDFIETNVKEMR